MCVNEVWSGRNIDTQIDEREMKEEEREEGLNEEKRERKRKRNSRQLSIIRIWMFHSFCWVVLWALYMVMYQISMYPTQGRDAQKTICQTTGCILWESFLRISGQKWCVLSNSWRRRNEENDGRSRKKERRREEENKGERRWMQRREEENKGERRWMQRRKEEDHFGKLRKSCKIIILLACFPLHLTICLCWFCSWICNNEKKWVREVRPLVCSE